MRIGWMLFVVGCARAEGPSEDAPSSESDVETLLAAALSEAPSGVDGIALLVADPDDEVVLSVSVGAFAADTRGPVASASKLVTGLAVLRLVETGALSLDDTPRDRLGWTGGAADATLDHLGAFVSGLPGDARCTLAPGVTLQDCVATLDALDAVAAPGDRFEYGSTHQAVAGAMAEVATGRSWASLFEETVKAPLGLTDPGLRYVTLPQQQVGGDNPLLAGGLVATPEEYLRMLSLLFHRGTVDGERWVASELVDRMARNPYADAELGNTPMPSYGCDYRYGWGTWLHCEGPAASCDVVSSPGAFGMSPWVDWDAGYYAVLGMVSDGPGGAAFSVPLMEALRPEIEAWLAAR